MNAIRRTAVLLGITVAVVIGSSIPASAEFSATTTAQPATVGTLAVAAPGAVTATVTTCHHPVKPALATVSWPGSTTTRGVTGYRVTAYLNDGTTSVIAVTGSAARSYSAGVDNYYLQFQPRVTVTTLTSYGWTTESAPSAVISC